VKRKRDSKTLWLNGGLILVFGLIELAATTFPVPPIVYSTMIFISGAGNMILRFYTSEAIK
jgi:hypothetical protein